VRRDSSPRLLLTHTRIAVAGASGSGKSTLAKRLAAMRGLPYVEMDALYYGSGWTPRANFSELADRHLCGEQWVTEWWYDEIIPLLVTRANLVIWLDYPLMLTATSVILRTLLRRLHHEVLWDGNREGGLLSALWNPHHALRYGLRGGRRLRQSLAAAIKASHGRFEIWRFTTPAQVSDWILAEQRRNTPNRSPKGAC
jgi:adenylate kinase family enzyme